MSDVKIVPHGDASMLIEWEAKIDPAINRKITGLVSLFKDQKIEGVIDFIPAFSTLLINYNPRIISYQRLKKITEDLLTIEIGTGKVKKRIFEIPVCYGGEYGPDIEFIMKHAQLSQEELIQIHSGTDYLIYMLGFLPGFSYLGGLDERIHTPRLDNPRKAIPAGSVGIGGSQTGIYPLESPGGWQLLGRTPVKTYDPERSQPILFDAGDYIRFVPIDEATYQKIEQAVAEGSYQVKMVEED